MLPPSMRTLTFSPRRLHPPTKPQRRNCARAVVPRNGCKMLSYNFPIRCGFAATTYVRLHIAEVLGQAQSLPLVIRPDALTVDSWRRFDEPLEHQAPGD